ncbi:uncharacterized protein LOC112564531 [Pomacea canaliculata]|nr:uncharacterized protein LOC112564531 [Pomacea canaliculata]
MNDRPLHTLQEFLAGNAPYVSVAMDDRAGIIYGTKICIPELNIQYNTFIVFEVVDMGSDTSGQGHSRINICVQDEQASRETTINSALTLVFPSVAPGLDCSGFGSHTYHATGTGYYPDDSPIEGGYVDMRGRPLRTLQDFLEGRVQYVSVAMDDHAGIAYGTRICIKELNIKYNKLIVFAVVDTGPSFRGKGYTRIDVCVEDERASLDHTINGPLTLVFP